MTPDLGFVTLDRLNPATRGTGESFHVSIFGNIGSKTGGRGGMTVLVCGGRTFTNAARVFRALEAVNPSRVVVGCAAGADAAAAQWAFVGNVPYEIFSADWKQHGKAAGPIRNQRMLDESKPDLVLAFPGGRGTADMVRRAHAAGVRVVEA